MATTVHSKRQALQKATQREKIDRATVIHVEDTAREATAKAVKLAERLAALTNKVQECGEITKTSRAKKAYACDSLIEATRSKRELQSALAKTRQSFKEASSHKDKLGKAFGDISNALKKKILPAKKRAAELKQLTLEMAAKRRQDLLDDIHRAALSTLQLPARISKSTPDAGHAKRPEEIVAGLSRADVDRACIVKQHGITADLAYKGNREVAEGVEAASEKELQVNNTTRFLTVIQQRAIYHAVQLEVIRLKEKVARTSLDVYSRVLEDAQVEYDDVLAMLRFSENAHNNAQAAAASAQKNHIDAQEAAASAQTALEKAVKEVTLLQVQVVDIGVTLTKIQSSWRKLQATWEASRFALKVVQKHYS